MTQLSLSMHTDEIDFGFVPQTVSSFHVVTKPGCCISSRACR